MGQRKLTHQSTGRCTRKPLNDSYLYIQRPIALFTFSGVAFSNANSLRNLCLRQSRCRWPPLSDSTPVKVLARGDEVAVRLPVDQEAELLDALDEADREEGISADELFARIRRFG